jgi:hypothetical protein
MTTMKPRTTRASFTSTTPYVAGQIPQSFHTFNDFAIPRTYALVSPINQYEMRFACVYVPNPWVPDEIRFREWVYSANSGWQRSKGQMLNIELARVAYRMMMNQGWTPRDVIADPLHGEWYMNNPWDEWACHFCFNTEQFYRIIPHYNYTYPRKAV